MFYSSTDRLGSGAKGRWDQTGYERGESQWGWFQSLYYTKETTEITDDVTFYSKCRNQWKRLEMIMFRFVIGYIEMFKSQLLSQIPEITIKNEERLHSQ